MRVRLGSIGLLSGLLLVKVGLMAQKTTLHILEPADRDRAVLARLGFDAGFHCEIYEDLGELLDAVPRNGVVLIRDDGPRSAIPELVSQLARQGQWCPFVGYNDKPQVDHVVQAIKGGTLSFISTPRTCEDLAAAMPRVVAEAEHRRDLLERAVRACHSLARLTERERQVLEGLVSGESSKAIARFLEISPRTVEIHRSKLLGKLGARNVADAVRVKIEASAYGALAA